MSLIAAAVMRGVLCAAILPGPDPWRIPTGRDSVDLHAVATFEAVDGVRRSDYGSAMMRRLHGIAGELDGRLTRQLASTGQAKQPNHPPAASEMRLLYVISLCVEGQSKEQVRLMQGPNGDFWAVRIGDPQQPDEESQLLDRARVMEIVEGWSAYQGTLDEPAIDRAEVRAIEPPDFASHIILDRETMSDRFLRGRTLTIPDADRLLRLERMFVRLPRGYTPRNPAGLLVWMDAGEKPDLPACLSETCDRANIVAIGIANCGNTRPVADRYQLALDAVATASRRFHIDSRRVYVSGFSGGGRVASALAACFPDVFTGCIPICGLSCYEAVPILGRGRAAPAFAKPQDRMFARFRKLRVAAITGGKDFNRAEIVAAAQLMRGDGAQVRTFETVELGHEHPPDELFDEAFDWVDEPYRTARADEIKQAEQALRSALSRIGDRAVTAKVDRAALVRVTEIGPWSEPAWKAAETLDKASRDGPRE